MFLYKITNGKSIFLIFIKNTYKNKNMEGFCRASQNLGYFIIVVVENIKTKTNKFFIYVFKVAI
jgi:hypothetical protein